MIRIRQRVPLAGTLGGVELAALHDTPRLPGETGNQRRNVYIDTETTGLSGGSGTLAFLLGVAAVDGDAIEVTQWLMTRFAAEAAALSAFAETLTDTDRLVSYNGKSYDLPLLLTRFRMQGLQPAFETLAHLDLLHPVRRLFGKRWNDCRLLSVEEQLLGFRRVDDLPGSEAPAAWFRYLREGQTEALIKVVEHNRQDILSLAVAHSVLAQATAQPQAFDIDLHALARWLCDSDNEDQARTLLQENTTSLCADGKRLLARSAAPRRTLATGRGHLGDTRRQWLPRIHRAARQVSRTHQQGPRCRATLLRPAAAQPGHPAPPPAYRQEAQRGAVPATHAPNGVGTLCKRDQNNS